MIMNETEALEFIEEQNIKFIRLAFSDIFGNLKNISINSSELNRAFNSGISFDASSVSGFLKIDESDLLLFPDPSTLTILPWRPSQGRVVMFMCYIKKPDGTAFEGDTRYLLKETQKQAVLKGFSFNIGPECEFFLFKLDENGDPTNTPIDRGNYFDIAPVDKGENIRRDICLTLDEMGFNTERSHHESGPGQMEIDFTYAPPLNSADNVLLFKNVVRTISAQSGMHATFIPKPLKEESGSGMHINLSVEYEKREKDRLLEDMTGGIISHINDMMAFTNPHVNSYFRLGKYEAPANLGWGKGNRLFSIRIPYATGNYKRLEVRSPDPSCNPYLAFTLIIKAAMEGIEQNMGCSGDSKKEQICSSLEKAVKLAHSSKFISDNLPSLLIENFLEKSVEEIKIVGDDFETSKDILFNRV